MNDRDFVTKLHRQALAKIGRGEVLLPLERLAIAYAVANTEAAIDLLQVRQDRETFESVQSAADLTMQREFLPLIGA